MDELQFRDEIKQVMPDGLLGKSIADMINRRYARSTPRAQQAALAAARQVSADVTEGRRRWQYLNDDTAAFSEIVSGVEDTLMAAA